MADDGPKKKKPPRKPVLAPRDDTAALPVSASSPRAPSPVPTAAKIAFYNLPSFLSDYRSRQADAETQRLLDEFARAGGDVSAHANLFGLSAAGGAAGAAGASMAIPVGGVAQAVKAGASPLVASGLAGAMGGLVQGALGQDDPGEMAKHAGRDALVGGVGGAALGRLAQFPVMQRSMRDGGGALLREMFDEPPVRHYPQFTPEQAAHLRALQEEGLARLRAQWMDDAVTRDIRSVLPDKAPLREMGGSSQMPREELMDAIWNMEHPGNNDAFFHPEEPDTDPLLDKIYGKLPSGGPKGDFPRPMGATPPEVPPSAGDWQPPLASRRFATSDFVDDPASLVPGASKFNYWEDFPKNFPELMPPDLDVQLEAKQFGNTLNPRGDSKEVIRGHLPGEPGTPLGQRLRAIPKPPIPPSPSGNNLNALLAALGLGAAGASTRRP